MSERKLFHTFKWNSYIGLFQYSKIPTCARRALASDMFPLHPPLNPYIGYFKTTIKKPTVRKLFPSTVDVGTQTDVDRGMEIGDKILKSYKI